jgi:hypothetical protein
MSQEQRDGEPSQERSRVSGRTHGERQRFNSLALEDRGAWIVGMPLDEVADLKRSGTGHRGERVQRVGVEIGRAVQRHCKRDRCKSQECV